MENKTFIDVLRIVVDQNGIFYIEPNQMLVDPELAKKENMIAATPNTNRAGKVARTMLDILGRVGQGAARLKANSERIKKEQADAASKDVNGVVGDSAVAESNTGSST